KENKYEIPKNSFDNSIILKVGNKNVSVKFFGEGHTKDNVVGYFPSENIMFGGCLIKELNAGKGFLGDANVAQWSNTVEKVKMEYPNVKIVVPGHGEYGDRELLDYTIELFKTHQIKKQTANKHLAMKQHKINKTFLIILLGILAAIGPFTIDMYLPAFGKIAESFGTDESHVAFTLTSYFFGIAIGQLIYGPVVDKYGRKKPLLFGLFLYVVSALGCAVSYSIEMMIIMRLFQALGGCVGMVASVSIISDVYEVDQRAIAFSSIMLVMGIAPLIAPSLGSLFLVIASWEYIFYFLTAFALLVWVFIYVFLPETSGYIHNKPLKIKTIAINYKTVI